MTERETVTSTGFFLIKEHDRERGCVVAESGMAVCYAGTSMAMACGRLRPDITRKIEQGSALCRALLPAQVLLTGSGFSVVRDGECLRCEYFNVCLQEEKKLKKVAF